MSEEKGGRGRSGEESMRYVVIEFSGLLFTFSFLHLFSNHFIISNVNQSCNRDEERLRGDGRAQKEKGGYAALSEVLNQTHNIVRR